MFLKVSFEDAKISKHDYFYCVIEGFFEYHLFEYIIIEYIEDAKISKRDYFYCLMVGGGLRLRLNWLVSFLFWD